MARRTTGEAYNAGYDAGLKGANTTNSHSEYFATLALKASWEGGNAAGIVEKAYRAEKHRNFYRGSGL